MGVIGDMNRYQQYQMGTAMTAAAENPAGGGAADGLGLGIGLAMANRMVPGAAPAGGAAAAGYGLSVDWHQSRWRTGCGRIPAGDEAA